MSSHDGSSRPYMHRMAWGPQARMQARRELQDAIEQHDGLLDVVEAAAWVVCQQLAARTVTVTLLQDDAYRDLVKVGEFAEDEQIDINERYPVANYPEATQRLMAHQAYVSGEPSADFHREHVQIVPPTLVSGFMGVPIVADGEVRGEIFVTRKASEPSFTEDDVEVARDLATELGSSFPRLLDEYAQQHPDW